MSLLQSFALHAQYPELLHGQSTIGKMTSQSVCDLKGETYMR